MKRIILLAVIVVASLSLNAQRVKNQMRRKKDLVLCGLVLRLLDHRQAIAPLIIFDLVHDVVNEQDAPARRFEQILRVERIWNVIDVETFALVFDGESGFFL